MWVEILKQIREIRKDIKVYLPFMLEERSDNYFEQVSKKSFALFAEDAIIQGISKRYQIPIKHYIDIGANHPILGNATFAFYLNGAKGFLVEPNPD